MPHTTLRRVQLRVIHGGKYCLPVGSIDKSGIFAESKTVQSLEQQKRKKHKNITREDPNLRKERTTGW